MSKPISRFKPWLLGAAALAVATVGVIAVTASRPKPVTVTLPSGTRVQAALDRTITTERAQAGDELTLTTRSPIPVGGDTIPAGLTIRGEVTHAKGGGRVAGAPELTIRVRTIAVGGDQVPVSAVPFRFKGRDDAKKSVLEIAGGVVAGAVLGEVIASAPVEGAVIGAAAGTAVAIATKGDQIVLPSGVILRVELTEPVALTFRPAGGKSEKADAGR